MTPQSHTRAPYHQTYQRVFGTYPLKGSVLHHAVRDALTVGYRAFDTAQMYGNEADLGSVLESAPIPREELFITTKVHPDHLIADRFIASVEQSLRDLRVDHVDLLLLHWPSPGGSNVEALELLGECAQKGLTAHIGVSNYTATMLQEATTLLSSPLATNQVEFHPLIDQTALLTAASAIGVPLSSYCSVARGLVLKHDLFAQIGSLYQVHPIQVVLRWIIQHGVTINTMSTDVTHMAVNFDVMSFTLSHVDMARIDSHAQSINHRIVDSQASPWAPTWD